MPYSELPNLLASLSSTFIGARLPVPLSPHLWTTIRFLAFTVDRRRYCGACGDGSPFAFAHLHSGSIPFVRVLGPFHPVGIILGYSRRDASHDYNVPSFVRPLLSRFAPAFFAVPVPCISASRSVQSSPSLPLPLLPPRSRAARPPAAWTSLRSTSPAPSPQRYLILLKDMMYRLPNPRGLNLRLVHSCSMIQIIFASSYSISYVPLSIFARTRAPPPRMRIAYARSLDPHLVFRITPILPSLPSGPSRVPRHNPLRVIFTSLLLDFCRRSLAPF